MSAVAAPPRFSQLPLGDSGQTGSERLRRSDGGRFTLEQRLDRVWEDLLAVGMAECPLCRGQMERTGDVARCCDCGTTLD